MSAYTTPDEVRKRALIKWDSLNYPDQPGVPFADEAALDAWLSGTVIPEAEKIINDHCLRLDFATHENETELVSGDGFRDFILLSKRPVTAVSKVELKGNGSWVQQSTSDYYVTGDRIQFRVVLVKGFQNIRVTYNWGFAAVPGDVSYCAAETVARFLQKRVAYKMGPLVRVGDYRVELSNPDVFTADLKEALEHYRREHATFR